MPSTFHAVWRLEGVQLGQCRVRNSAFSIFVSVEEEEAGEKDRWKECKRSNLNTGYICEHHGRTVA